MKAYTDLEQSKKLAEILPLESADMFFWKRTIKKDDYSIGVGHSKELQEGFTSKEIEYIPSWSLAALLEELNRNCWKVSLKCCGAEWDMTYDDGERYINVSSDYAIDACYEMILKLHKHKLL